MINITEILTILPETHPAVYDDFKHDGGFSLQIGAHKPFGWIPVDQTIEDTVWRNKRF